MVLAALAALWHSSSEARPLTLAMSCDEAKELVNSAGAVVFDVGPDMFERFVSSEWFCMPDEYASYGVAPTVDTDDCPLYVCRSSSFLSEDGAGRPLTDCL